MKVWPATESVRIFSRGAAEAAEPRNAFRPECSFPALSASPREPPGNNNPHLIKYVGLDVHAQTVAVAIAYQGDEGVGISERH